MKNILFALALFYCNSAKSQEITFCADSVIYKIIPIVDSNKVVGFSSLIVNQAASVVLHFFAGPSNTLSTSAFVYWDK